MNKHIPQLDWKAYFARFSELHGGNPLQWRGWLVFPDGWRYSASSHAGPEAAPEDEAQAKFLMSVYWKMRLASVTKERRELRMSLVGLEQQMRVMSAPLQQRIHQEKSIQNEYGKELTVKVASACDLDLGELRSRIRELEEDALQCERVLADLKSSKEKADVKPTSTSAAGH